MNWLDGDYPELFDNKEHLFTRMVDVDGGMMII